VINLNGNPMRGSDVSPLTNSAGAVVGYLAIDPTAGYIRAREGMWANAGRNTVRLPGINNFDLAVGKRFHLTERWKAEFRAEFFNAFNHPQFTPGQTTTANPRARVNPPETSMLIPGNSLFLRPELAFESNARSGQLVLRLEF
jgi:hypothetical protein